VLLGSLALDEVWVRDLGLVGDRALLLGASGGGVMPISSDVRTVPGSSGPISALVEVDLSDPAAPRVERKLLVDGSYLSARMIAAPHRRRSCPPASVFQGPQDRLRAERGACRNQDIIRTHDQERLPTVLEDRPAGRSPSRSTTRPRTAGIRVRMLTILTIDLSEASPLPPSESVGVLSDGQTVYGRPLRRDGGG
jgi:hypothetical protein